MRSGCCLGLECACTAIGHEQNNILYFSDRYIQQSGRFANEQRNIRLGFMDIRSRPHIVLLRSLCHGQRRRPVYKNLFGRGSLVAMGQSRRRSSQTYNRDICGEWSSYNPNRPKVDQRWDRLAVRLGASQQYFLGRERLDYCLSGVGWLYDVYRRATRIK